jgi:Predicted hydrolases or acyltransferases (alpha/beta hydrolase superfamily)
MAPPLHHKIDGSGAHVVLLHPVGLDLTFLEPVAAELRRNFTVLSVDLRGHGQSPAVSPAQSLDDYADDVHALLHKRGFAPAAMVGFSFAAWWRNTSRSNIRRMSVPSQSAPAHPN